MKKLFTTLFLLISFVLLAQYAPTGGNLNVFSDSGDRFLIYVNGELQNKEPQSNLRIENLNQKYYNVKIVFEDKTLKDITKNYVSVMAQDGVTFEEATYKVKVDAKTRKTKMNYFSSAAIIPDFIPPSDVYIIHDQKSPVNSNVIINNGINININTNQKEVDAHQRRSKEPNKPEMSPMDFQIAKTAIKKESFDDKKLLIAQNIIANNFLRAEQIAQITATLSFSKNKMDFVKSAYNSCVDIKNYYQIKDVFTFEIDKKEFMDFINSK